VAMIGDISAASVFGLLTDFCRVVVAGPIS
jgi:hypothetical protein